MKLSELFALYILELEEKRSPATISTYKCKFATIVKVFNDMSVEDISIEVAQDHFIKLSNNYSNKSIISFLDVTRAAYKYAVNEKLVKSNPFNEVSINRDLIRTPLSLSREETEHILYAFSYDKVLYLPLLIAAETGLKRSEVLNLKWLNIDFLNAEIIVEKHLVSSKNRAYMPKGILFRFPMSSKLSSTLMSVMNYRRENNIPATATDYICLNSSLNVMKATYFNKLFQNHVKKHQDIPQNIRFSDVKYASYIQKFPKKVLSLNKEEYYFKQTA